MSSTQIIRCRHTGGPAKLNSRENSTTELGLLTLLLIVAWSAFGIAAIQRVLPYNPIRVPVAQSIKISIWAPEGWAFFTRPPQEMKTLVLGERNGEWISASLGPQARPANFFGMNRASRAQGIELGLLNAQIPVNGWRPCEDVPVSCLKSAPVVTTLENRSPHPTYCGKIGIVRQRPVPWAWQASARKINMPSYVVVVRSECLAE